MIKHVADVNNTNRQNELSKLYNELQKLTKKV
jgi:hypothetical protein